MRTSAGFASFVMLMVLCPSAQSQMGSPRTSSPNATQPTTQSSRSETPLNAIFGTATPADANQGCTGGSCVDTPDQNTDTNNGGSGASPAPTNQGDQALQDMLNGSSDSSLGLTPGGNNSLDSSGRGTSASNAGLAAPPDRPNEGDRTLQDMLNGSPSSTGSGGGSLQQLMGDQVAKEKADEAQRLELQRQQQELVRQEQLRQQQMAAQQEAARAAARRQADAEAEAESSDDGSSSLFNALGGALLNGLSHGRSSLSNIPVGPGTGGLDCPAGSNLLNGFCQKACPPGTVESTINGMRACSSGAR